jgi:hypothetical protein
MALIGAGLLVIDGRLRPLAAGRRRAPARQARPV